MVVLDTSANPYSESSFEEAVSAAASLCVAAIRNGFPLELRTTAGGAVAADQGGTDVTAVLDLLAGVQRSNDDQGLAVLPGIIPSDESVALGVVTGQPRPELLAILPAVRPRFLMLSLVQFPEEFTAPPAALRGVVAVNVRNGEEFTASWNLLVRR